MISQTDIDDWFFIEVQRLDTVAKTNAFSIPSNETLYKPLYEAANKIYAEVLTRGQYQGLCYAFPAFLDVMVYERKH